MKLYILLLLMSVFVWFSYAPLRGKPEPRTAARRNPPAIDD